MFYTLFTKWSIIYKSNEPVKTTFIIIFKKNEFFLRNVHDEIMLIIKKALAFELNHFHAICKFGDNGTNLHPVSLLKARYHFHTNTPHRFHVDTTWKRPFPRGFKVESAWCVCRVLICSSFSVVSKRNCPQSSYW